MSLARNPNMPYVSAGRQDSPFERMNVRSNVYVPDADARADCDGRPAYQAPADARRQPFGISVKVFVILVAAALFILAMFYISAVARRAAIVKEGQRVYSEIQSLDREILQLKEEIAKAQEPNNLCYQASYRLGMINGKGVEPIEIDAPDMRPRTASPSLAAGAERALLSRQ